MRASRFFISTLKEAPGEAELLSHKLMLRAGLIKKLGRQLLFIPAKYFEHLLLPFHCVTASRVTI